MEPTKSVPARGLRTKARRRRLAGRLTVAALLVTVIGTTAWTLLHRVSNGSPDIESPNTLPAKPSVAIIPPQDGVKATDTSAPEPGTAAPAPVPVAGFFDVIHPENEEAEKAAALLVLEHFRSATTWPEKARFVRQTERVRPLMETFYEKRHGTEPATDGQRVGLFVHGKGAPVLHVAFADKKGSQPSYADLVREPDGAYLLDWESFVAAGEMDWEDFIKTRPTQPQLLRCVLSVTDYFNYEFTDKGRYVSLWLQSDDGERSLYAFCERNSALATKVGEHLKTARAGADRVTVRVAFPEKAQSDNCVRLVELVADRWTLPE